MSKAYRLARLATFLGMVLLIFGLGLSIGRSYGYECGDILSEGTWKGVVGYHNGPYHTGKTIGTQWTCGPYTVHGWAYQCVQYVNSFYYAAGLKKSIWTGDANQYFGNAINFGLTAFDNESTTPPKVNDILCFEGGGHGHVAIITGVTLVAENSYRIDIVEQNWSDSGAFHLGMDFDPVNKTYTIESRENDTYEVEGWLRIPYSCQLYGKDPSHTITVHAGETYTFTVYYTNTMVPRPTNLLKSFGALDWKNDAPAAIHELTLANQYRDNDSLAKFHYIELHSCNSEGKPTESFLYPGDGLWISNDKIRVVAQDAPNVGYNQNAHFVFQGKIPEDRPAGVYNIYFRPYHATAGYLEDWSNLHFTVEIVDSPGYTVGQGASADIAALFSNAYTGHEDLLGNPISCVKEARSGFGTSGYYQRFEHGSIQVHSGSTFIVYGPYYEEWGHQNPPYASWAGFPTSNVYSWNNLQRQDFEGGYIYGDSSQAKFVSITHPMNLTAQVQENNSVLLIWQNRIIANGISVYRSSSPAQRIAVLGPEATSFADDQVEAGQSVSYYIQAYNNTAESPFSNEVGIKSSTNPNVKQATFYSGTGPVKDGYIFNHGFDDYAGLQSAGTANEVSDPAYTTILSIGQDKAASGEYYIYRAAIPFDTSSLPYGCKITDATLYFYGYGADYSDTNFEIKIVQSGQGSVEALALSDFGKFGNVAGGVLNTGNWQSQNGLNSITFNETGWKWINQYGITKLGLRSNMDTGQIEPIGPEFVNIWSAESGTSYLPYLVVNYEEAGTGLDDGPWPCRGHDSRHTGQSQYVGAQNAALKWSYSTGGNIYYSSPAIGADGTIYVGSYDGKLYALRPDGSLKWSHTTGGYISSPAIGADGTIYVGSQDGKLYALKPDGSLKWSYTTWSYVYSSPAIGADGTIYVGSQNYKLYALRPDGSLKWSYTTGWYVSSSPAIGADGTIYVGSSDGKLYALKPDGSLKWSYDTGSYVFSPAIGADGTIYVGINSGYVGYDYKLYAIKPDGSLKWSYGTGSRVNSSPAIGADGTIYMRDDRDVLCAINPDGSLKWCYYTTGYYTYTTGGGGYFSSPAIGADGTIYVGSGGDKLCALDPDGSLKWSYDTGNYVYSPAIGADGTIYVGNSDGKLYAFALDFNLPQITNVWIEASRTASGASLTGHYTYVDEDNDPENTDPTTGTKIKWYQNGNYISNLDNTLAISVANTPGDHWQLYITPHDGKVYGPAHSTSVIIPGPLVAPSLISPANGAEGYCNPTFQWSQEGTSGYTFDLLLGTSFPPPVHVSDITGTTYTLTDNKLLADGTYVWKIRARNCFGETIESGVRSIRISNTPPTPVLNEPAASAYTNGQPTFTWTITNPQPDVTSTLYLDDQQLKTRLTKTEEGWTYTLNEDEALSEGNHTWRVDAVGCTGATAQSGMNWPFTVDRTGPASFNLLSPADNSWFNAADSVVMTWQEAIDNAVGLDHYEFWLDGNKVADVQGEMYQLVNNAFYNFSSSDQLNDWQLVGRWEIVDNMLHGSPFCSYNGCYNYSATLNRWLMLTSSSLLSCYVEYLNSNYGDDAFLQIREEGGDWSTLARYSSIGSSGGWNVSYNLMQYAGKRVQIGFSILTNFGTTASEIKIDNLRIADLAEGQYTWQVIAVDTLGNKTESSSTWTIGVDLTPPNIAPSGISTIISTNTKPTFTWGAAQDELSGISSYDIIVDNTVIGTVTSETLSFTPEEDLTEGTYTYKIRARDIAGNTRDSTAATLYVDLTPPNAPPLVSPADNAWVSFMTPDLCWNNDINDTEGGSGIAYYELYLDGAKIAGPITSSCTTGFGLEGPHTWYVIVYDKAGWSTQSEEWTFIVETEPPLAFNHISPTNGDTIPTLYPLFSWQATTDAGSGLDHYELTITKVNTSPPQTVTLTIPPQEGATEVSARPTSPLGNGSYTWLVKAYDRAGQARAANGGAGWGLTVNLDVTPPSCAVTVPSENALFGGESPVLSGTATDNPKGSGVAKVEICFDDECPNTWHEANLSGSDPSFTWSYTWTNPTDGFHTVKARSTDREGNIQQDLTIRNYRVDLAGPRAFNLLSPENDTWQTGQPTFTWEETTDTVSDMGRYEMLIWPEGGSRDQATPIKVGLSTQYQPETLLSHGHYHWTVQALDVLGNGTYANQTRTIKVDRQGPLALTLTSQQPTQQIDGLFWNKTGEITLTWGTTSDQGVGMAITPYALYVNGALKTTTSENSYTYQAGSDGSFEWYVIARDKLGNTTQSNTLAFRVDTRGPGVTPATYGFRLYANQIPILTKALDTGIDIMAGNIYRIFSVGELCFADSASCHDGCFDSAGIDTHDPSFTRWPDWPQYPFGRTIAFVGSSKNAYSIGHGATITFEHSGRLYLAVNSHNQRNCPAKWRSVTIQLAYGFNLLRPVNETYTEETTPHFYWTPAVDEGVGVARLQLFIDNHMVIDNLAPETTDCPIPSEQALTEGKHEWYLKAIDKLGQEGISEKWKINIDLTGPEPFELISPTENQILSSQTPTISWQAAHDALLADVTPGGGLAYYEPWIDEVANSALETSHTSTEPVQPLADGTHTVQVKVYDIFGRERVTNIRSFMVDSAPPESFALLSPTDASTVCTNRPTFCWEKAFDAASGIDRYELHIGENTVVINPAQTDQICYQMEGALDNGFYTWYVRAIDRAGRVRDTEEAAFTLEMDTLPPHITITGPGQNSCQGAAGFTLTGDYADDPSGCSSGVVMVEVSRDGGQQWRAAQLSENDHTWEIICMVSTDGPITLVARAKDLAGNLAFEGDRPSLTVIGDVTPPQGFNLLSPPAGSWCLAAPAFNWQAAQDTGCGVVRYTLILDEGTASLTEIPLGNTTSYTLTGQQALSQGEHTWAISAFDASGQATTTGKQTIKVDTTMPGAPTLTGPADKAWSNQNTFTLSWNAAQDQYGEVGSYRLILDQGGPILVSSGLSYQTGVLAEGDHTWAVAALDWAGNIGSYSQTWLIRVDRTKPGAPLLQWPENGEYIANQRPTLRWMASTDGPAGNPSLVCRYRISLGGNTYETTSDITEFTPENNLPAGAITWSVVAIDCAGNIGPASSTNTFTIDSLPPEVSVTPDAGCYQQTFDITLSMNEAGSIHYTLDDTTPTASSPEYTGPMVINTDREFNLKFVGIDLAGNKSPIQTLHYILDSTPPVPDIAPLPEIRRECEEVTLTSPTATDNLSGKITGTTNNPISYTNQGTYTVIWSYNDGHGHAIIQTQTVIIDDTQPSLPDIANLPDISGQCGVIITPPTATDNCTGAITGIPADPLAFITNGTYTITWAYNDGYGHTSTQTQQVTLIAPWASEVGMDVNMVIYGMAYDGQKPAADDWIGAFGPGGEEDCRAVGKVQTDGYYYLTITGDIQGEPITFKLFRCADSQILDTQETIVFASDSTMADKNLYFGVYTQTINLINGWNWVSFNVLPDNTSLESFFGAYLDSVKQVKTQLKSATNAAGLGWIGDDLTLMSKISEGIMFKIKTKAAFNLTITGVRIDRDLPIELQQGWSWLAYLPDDCLVVEDAIASILGEFSQIKAQTQSKIKLPNGSHLGDLLQMCPGKGYTVKMNVNGTLIYPLQ